MATLLHLSDLHLGSGTEANEEFGDHKVEVIDPPARQTRSSILRATLEGLADALQANGESLDAVVVSGDVTYQGNKEGFALLSEALGHLGPALPDSSRIVVVPGNHDVSWFTKPGSRERYQNFVDVVRAHGYVTPCLEGIDIDSAGNKVAGAVTPTLVADDSSFVIVALNSADHCGVVAQANPELDVHIESVESRTDDPAAAAILEAYRNASLFDIARIGDHQRAIARQALLAAVDSLDEDPVRIAVLHHQLLPISLEEEIKPFESLANLAQVRDWLALNEVDLVLHGHKHVAVSYEDLYVPLGPQTTPDISESRRVTVSAVGTVGLGQSSTNCVARLIRVKNDRARLGKIQAVDIPGIQPGTPIDLAQMRERTTLARVNPAHEWVIAGSDSQSVHEQLLERLDNADQLPQPLVCHVSDPSSASAMPGSYASLASVPSDEDWFRDLVGLWQNPQRLSAMKFNHGERIFAMRGIDQFDNAIQCLSKKDTSSRAVIVLFDHEKDDIKADEEFPAFCLVHVFVYGDELRIVGYFRKQEMRYWWPVNLAELAMLQRQAVERLNLTRGNNPLRPGIITTVTAIPTAGSTVPRVDVPRLDRWVDEEPDLLVRMAVVAFDPTISAAAEAVIDWEHTVSDCRPRDLHAADGDPVPIAGLERVRQHLRSLRMAYGASALTSQLSAVLQRAAVANSQYVEQARRQAISEGLRMDLAEIHAEFESAVAQLRDAVTAAEERR